MSQFLLAIIDLKPTTDVSDITFVPASEAQEVFGEVVDYYGIDQSHAWAVLDETGDTTDSIFSEAGLQLSQGDPLSSTQLGKLLGELIYKGAKFIAWYACEYQDLEQTDSVIDLIEILNKELPIGSGEIYVEYR
ncbi:hypothetical protein [Microbulbifer sp. TRSA007]|uniref:hypothetical protein n=1 Tax=unclassified Microbulbifer TaxID=2619833 RepID=UPI0040393199